MENQDPEDEEEDPPANNQTGNKANAPNPDDNKPASEKEKTPPQEKAKGSNPKIRMRDFYKGAIVRDNVYMPNVIGNLASQIDISDDEDDVQEVEMPASVAKPAASTTKNKSTGKRSKTLGTG